MKTLHIYSCLEVTDDGGEYINYEFIMAHSLHDAWFLAGYLYAEDLDDHDVEGGYSNTLNSTLTVNVYGMDSEEFWDIFSCYSNLWRDKLLAWAVENRELVSDFLQRAQEMDCKPLLGIPELLSIAEHYTFEEDLRARSKPGIASRARSL
jgi:hypothetical protein